MATENIIVNFSVNAEALKPTIDLLVKMGQISEKDAAEFKKLVDQTSKFNKEIEKTGKEAKKAGDETDKAIKRTVTGFEGMKQVFDGLLSRIAAVFAIDRIIRFGVDSVKAFQEAELNARKLETAVINIGEEGEEAFQRLIKQSKEFQKISIFSDDEIQAAQVELSQFGLLSHEIEKIIPKILDLASAKGMDLRQATDLVIQGINGQTRALKPLGLEFTNTGDKAQNFAIITEKLNRHQGAAASILETSAGKMKNLGNQINDLMERFGELIATSGAFSLFQRALAAIIDSFKTLDDLRLEAFDARLQEAIRVAAVEIKLLESVGNTREQAFAKERKIIADRLDALGKEAIANANNRDQTEKQFVAEGNRIERLKEASRLELRALVELEKQLAVKTEITKLGLTDDEIAKRAAELREQEAKLLQEIGAGMKKIQADYAGLTVEQRNIVNLTNEWAEALAKGPASLREFKNKITEIITELEKAPTELKTHEIKVDVLLSTNEIEELAKDSDLKDSLNAIFGDLKWDELTHEQLDFIRSAFKDFASDLKNIFFSVFDLISAKHQARAEELESIKEQQLSIYDEELERLEELNNNKIISDGQYALKQKEIAKQREATERELNRKIAEEKRKAFIAERTASLLRVGISTAEGIAKTVANLGFPAAIPFIAIAAALGAAQAAIIAATPIPKFKRGVIGLQGPGTETSDSIPAMLSRNESVMTAAETKAFGPTLNAIRFGLVSPEILNRVAVNHKFDPVEAYMDTGKLTRSQRKLIPRQADAIGRSVAKHLKQDAYYNPLI